jgi:hypothetical protein
MSGFARQHEYRIGRALILASVAVVGCFWLFPVEWLRVLGRRVDLEIATVNGPNRKPSEGIRLIPVEALDLGDYSVRKQTIKTFNDSPDIDDSGGPERHEWAFDPTTAWAPAAGSTEPIAGAVPDSVLLRADFLNSLRLANRGAVFAMLDTTRTGRAREQFAETDRWVNRYYGPVWDAQGFARRQSNLWNRVVHEVETEGSH